MQSSGKVAHKMGLSDQFLIVEMPSNSLNAGLFQTFFPAKMQPNGSFTFCIQNTSSVGHVRINIFTHVPITSALVKVSCAQQLCSKESYALRLSYLCENAMSVHGFSWPFLHYLPILGRDMGLRFWAQPLGNDPALGYIREGTTRPYCMTFYSIMAASTIVNQ